jgi:hypothetical protein
MKKEYGVELVTYAVLQKNQPSRDIGNFMTKTENS